MEPAKTIIDAFGGVSAISELTGVHRAQVSKWRWPKMRGGTDGRIPERHWAKLIAEATARGIKITYEDLLPKPIAGEVTSTEQAIPQ